MKNLILLSTALLLPLISPLVARAQSVPDQQKVVPGERIGRIFLGDSRDAVRRRLGKPTATFKLNRGLISELWKSKPSESGRTYTLEVVYDNGTAVQIETTNPVFRTKSGLSIVSDPDNWMKPLGSAQVSPYYIYPQSNSKKGLSQQYYDWKSAGIAIETLAEGEEVANHTLIVHAKNIAVIRDPGGVLEP